MSLPPHKPTKVSVRLEASGNVLLDLMNGVSCHIYFCVRNEEDKAVTLIIPGFTKHKVTDSYTTRSFDFMSALSQGVFHIKGRNFWSNSPLDEFKVADTVTSQPTHLVISPGATAKYVLLSRGSRDICHIGLRARGIYALGFNDPSGKIKYRFSTLEEETYFKEKREIPMATFTDGQDHSALFQSTGHPIRIEVMPRVPTPRFQMSFRLSSGICNLSGPPSFFLGVIVKSLEPKPVLLRMDQEPWSDFHGFEGILSLTDVATGNDIELPIMNWCFDEGVKILDDRTYIGKEVCFREGSERTQKFKFGTAELECLQSNRTYMVKTHKIEFFSWCYEELGHTDDLLVGINGDGPISPEIVEATPTFASIVEKTIEAGSTGPFHRLPRELRTMIYENLAATEPDVLYFRTEA